MRVLYYSVVNVRLRADSGAVKKESYIFSHMYTERKTGFANYFFCISKNFFSFFKIRVFRL